MKPTIGIDFGTTKTIAAYIDSTEMRPRSVRLGRNDAIPTTLYVDPSGRIETGDDADDNRILDWKGYVRRIKRDLGRKKKHLLNGHSLSTVDLIGHFLCKVLEKVEKEAIYARPEHVVITVPAKYGPAKREELEKGIKAAGILSYEIITEPVAAALAWLALNPNSELGRRVMVFDWGGGTLDVAILERNGNGFSDYPSLIDGDEILGGEDLDDALIGGVDAMFLKGGFRSFEQRNEKERDLIIRRVVENKILHSRRAEVSWSFAFEDMKSPISWKWSKEEFDETVRPFVNRAVERARKVKELAASQNVLIDHVILIGGSSRIPLVATSLVEKLGVTPLRWDRCIEAVAYGAALHAYSKFESPPIEQEKLPHPTLSAADKTIVRRTTPGIQGVESNTWLQQVQPKPDLENNISVELWMDASKKLASQLIREAENRTQEGVRQASVFAEKAAKTTKKSAAQAMKDGRKTAQKLLKTAEKTTKQMHKKVSKLLKDWGW